MKKLITNILISILFLCRVFYTKKMIIPLLIFAISFLVFYPTSNTTARCSAEGVNEIIVGDVVTMHPYGSFTVISNNKYQLKSGRVRIILYNVKNDQILMTDELYYKNGDILEYDFSITKTDDLTALVKFEVYDIEIEKSRDVIISILLVIIGTFLSFKVFIGQINSTTYKTDSNHSK